MSNCVGFLQLRYRLEDPAEQMDHARSVFEVNARKLVMQMLSNARSQVVNDYLKLHDHEVGSFRDASDTYLTEEQYAEVGCVIFKLFILILLSNT